jgi:hypothetical protein
MKTPAQRLTAEDILAHRLRGSTWFKHRNNVKRHKILHIASDWALHWHAGESYGCGYGPTYVSGGVDLILIPEGLHAGGGDYLWDTGRDRQGPVTANRLKRIIEVVTEEIAADRANAAKKASERLKQEFSRNVAQ